MLLRVLSLVIILIVISPNCSAKKIKVAFGNTLAPWVMTEDNNGILLDLITEAMEPLGYEIEKAYYPYGRRIMSYKSKTVDVVCDINQTNIINSNLSGYFSGVIYAYENFAFSLKKRDFNFSKINELSKYSILSWQGARKQLGSTYSLMADNNPSYMETYNQKLQVKMLFMERVDVIQLDKQIFQYYRANLIKSNEIDESIEVDQFSLFGKSQNGFLFRSVKARDDFVKQIEIMKADGRYNQIFNKYTL